MALQTVKKNLKMYPVSIAPMMDWTDRHYRYFMRQITKKTLLYTEMVTTGAILFGDKDKHLGFSDIESPLVLQLGGDDPTQLSECAKIAQSYGYTEINLNVGCPSERVQKGNFGACLMATPELVGECVARMQDVVDIPVTVKHRIGIDNNDSYEELHNFVKIVSSYGCQRFVVHARKAILKGLSPRENRTIPPLKYDFVYNLKKDFPDLIIEINGGIKTLDEVKEHLKYTDSVMLGRIAYENPYIFARVDSEIFGENTEVPSRREIIENMIPYLEDNLKKDIWVNRTIIHILGLFNNQPGSKLWKRYLSENMHKRNTDPSILAEALKMMPDDILDSRDF
ncbi:tRNA dihydrouridine(20/20a) synthase DusA [bacterium]|nr:MAG: tRNA dihydrouridine(20/20a) synthase DusA [bacterium]